MSTRTVQQRRRAWVVGAVAAAVVVWVALAAGQTALAWSELRGARDLATDGAETLLAGDAAGAETAFARARDDLASARGRLTGPALAPVRVLPAIGPNVDALATVAAGGARLADGGAAIAAGVAGLPEGLSSLMPRDGTVPIGRLADLESAVNRARAAAESADAAVPDAPPGGLVRPVARAHTDLASRVADARRALDSAAALVEVLPDFLGADGPRRYFLGAQNPAELRGTGGLIGAYAILTVDRGRVQLSEFQPIQNLDTVPAEDAPAPSEQFAERYNRYGGAGFWLTINMTPHGPSAAQAIEGLYRQVTGTRLDGTVLVTPRMLASLLRVTGPVDVPGTDMTVDSDSAVEVLTNTAYARIENPDARKRVLGATAGRALSRFLGGRVDADPSAALRALGETASAGNLLLHARDEDVQAAFEEARLAATLAADGTDFLGVVLNNAAANKADYYQERSLRYEVDLRSDGTAQSRVTLDVANHAPTRGEPYVVGPNVDTAEAGENRSLVSVYCATGCQRRDFRRSVGQEPLRRGRERGLPVFTTMMRLASGQEGRVELDFELAEAWEDRGGAGVYELTLRGQPTVRPTHVEVVVHVPEGARIQSVDPGGDVSPSRVRWTGSGLWQRRFRVTFAPP